MLSLQFWKRDHPTPGHWELTLTSEDPTERAKAGVGAVGWLQDGTEFVVTGRQEDPRFPGKLAIVGESEPLSVVKNLKGTLDKGTAAQWFVTRARSLLPGGVYGMAVNSIAGQYVTDWGRAKRQVDDADDEKDPDLRLPKARNALQVVLRLRKESAPGGSVTPTAGSKEAAPEASPGAGTRQGDTAPPEQTKPDRWPLWKIGGAAVVLAVVASVVLGDSEEREEYYE